MFPLVAVCLAIALLEYSSALEPPSNPCPNYLQYRQYGNQIEGVLTIPNDFTGYYVITVNGSVPFYEPNEQLRMKVEIEDYNAAISRPTNYLVYVVGYQHPRGFPKITSVVFNGQQLCYSNPYIVRPGAGVTNLWASYDLTASVQRQRPQTDNGFNQGNNFNTWQNNFNPGNPFTGGNTFEFKPGNVFKPDGAGNTFNPNGIFNQPDKPSNTFFFNIEDVFKPGTTVRPTPPAASGDRFQPDDFNPNPGNTDGTFNLNPENNVNTDDDDLNIIFSKPTGRPVIRPQIVTSTEEGTLFTSEDKRTSLTPNIPGGTCGRTIDSIQLIVNGNDVRDGEFPWMGALFVFNSMESKYEYKCTTNVVSTQHAITAGHCVQFENFLIHQKENLFVVLGKVNLQDWRQNSVLRTVEEIFVHPQYQQGKAGHDLAMFKLTEPISSSLQPICVWSGSRNLQGLIKTGGVVAGWGQSKPGEASTKWAKKTNVPVVGQDDCLRSSITAYKELISGETFCGGGTKTTGPCTGDSGAGYYVKDNGLMYLRGVTTYALGRNDSTCDLDKYAVFADLAMERQWINDILRK